MASPMSLRRAVELTRTEYRRLSSMNAAEADALERADAIVDAAVEAHEAREGVRAAFESRPMAGGLEAVRDHMRAPLDALHEAENKLRALERGEESK